MTYSVYTQVLRVIDRSQLHVHSVLFEPAQQEREIYLFAHTEQRRLIRSDESPLPQ